jgi:mRNA-degrading endonuclease RelE of RelBE toxin-antitoxin system
MIKKNQILIENDGVFEIKNDDDSNLFTQIIFSTANDDTRIYSYSREKSSFDFYNEIIVFGKSHKAIRKELKSIKKKGRKTLQIFENELTTQHDVDERASELLKIHSDNSFGLKLTVGHKGISQLRVGDIVTVEIPEENIPRSEFIVLEIQHNLTGTMDLELGSYTKGLEDRFAELQIESRAVNNKIRENAFDDSQISFDFLNGINVNTIKILARKKTVPSGSFTLGTNSSDSETLNTNTNALNIGVTTFTTLLEEEF